MLKSKNLNKFIAAMSVSLLLTQPAFAATYKVVPNDSLYKISKVFNTSVNSLKSDNKLDGDIIYPGQAISVPAKVHSVVYGESLYLISKKYSISLESLRRANNKWDNLIYPNDKLLIPSTTSVTSNSNTNNTSLSSGQAKSIKSVIPYTQNDLDLLSRLVHAEAGGESYNTKVCVASVVINRVKSNKFPNSIKNVIYEVSDGHYQFTPVLNGMINKAASADDQKAALEALSGNDPTKGALYFFDNTVTNQWLLSKPVALHSDKMTFAY
ncbi:cell wall hydrolase [Clostridium botulinum]|uniref:Peptidoglycan-binding protein n=1 Tax=Clostridium botulinum TaxID=1491 RepID=A0A9Q1UWV6_CLOBO|nr:cell wall hydrolase [Clostridium botulinum]AEB75346.1 LysM-repeat protein [Clostridium botulinum BKT015925]KEI02332.1 peptidoglycan-binding protein [Clostridium botulinum D str. 16868]KEI03959.1 peptidoglycan-binding protein [Clostridium botulinum C/D str. Sp77]KLU76829.1 peptidoglycan-binding protein [Clostridium botulinum V891]KOA73535.1 peptidoglycan-binding protein [Clostridium botulinum]